MIDLDISKTLYIIYVHIKPYIKRYMYSHIIYTLYNDEPRIY
jgi:hypothetical protein